jgi:uncharacterized 2Fe-2S/4Fe-4S cluster protein (DUF4445 family)
MRLYDLATGTAVATQSLENPQRFGGSDVMARIHYDSNHKGRLLQRTLLGYLGHAIERFPVAGDDIHEMTVAANTTMRDLFFGLDVYSIGQKPYRSVTEHDLLKGLRTTTALQTKARALRLPMNGGASVYGLPLIGSHVGADAAACLLATGMAEGSEVCVLMDIGTNTELIMGNRDRIVVASCPAGPAFEGGGVLCGMPALDGAIERFAINNDGKPSIQVIGDVAPVGICGSGLVDLLSELLRTERMNAQGRFHDDAAGTYCVDESGIVFTESDINELAQAKGANVAGLRIVADVFGITLEDIDRFYLAGGFAHHLDIEAAKRIGLIPSLPSERIFRIGNAALEGASRVLLSHTARTNLKPNMSSWKRTTVFSTSSSRAASSFRSAARFCDDRRRTRIRTPARLSVGHGAGRSSPPSRLRSRSLVRPFRETPNLLRHRRRLAGDDHGDYSRRRSRGTGTTSVERGACR